MIDIFLKSFKFKKVLTIGFAFSFQELKKFL